MNFYLVNYQLEKITCAFELGEFNQLGTTVQDKSVCNFQKICQPPKQKIREIAVNEKIRESITIQFARHSGGVSTAKRKNMKNAR